MSQYLEIASLLIKKALNKGANAADVLVNNQNYMSVHNRMGKIESIEQARTIGLGLRVFIGAKQAIVSTNDLTDPALEDLADKAIQIAQFLPDDKWAGLASEELLASNSLQFAQNESYDSSMPSLDELTQRAYMLEAAAFEDKRIHNSEGASISFFHGSTTLTTSTGFQGSYQKSYYTQSVCVLAKDDDGKMERDYEYDTRTFYKDLYPADTIGKKVATRVLKRLNPKKISSQIIPVIFEPRIASSLLQHLVEAINGHSITKSESFLKDYLHKSVFSKNITIIDDPYLSKGLSFRPFDAEGLATSKQTIVNQGTLNQWLLDLRSSRQLGLPPTGHASRSIGSMPYPSPSNIYIINGSQSPEEMIRNIKQGLFVTDLMGSGVNPVTGDYSRGAAGLWIENGELTHAVNEVTIAGNLKDMFASLIPANDLDFKRLVATPTLLIPQMTLAGR